MTLKEWRVARGLTLAKAAEIVGAHDATTYRRWEEGTNIPRPARMRQIIQATNARVAEVDFYRPAPSQSGSKAATADCSLVAA